MKIAVIVPWVYAVRGNIIDLANELGRLGNEVDLLAYEVFEGIIDEVNSKCDNCNFIYKRELNSNSHGKWKYFYKQILRDYSKPLLKFIIQHYKHKKYDAVVLIASEGMKLGKNLKRKTSIDPPISVFISMEIPEHNLKNVLTGCFPRLGIMFLPFYYIMHRRYRKLLNHFDLVFSNSEWTRIMVDFFYKMPSAGIFQSISNTFFEEPLGKAINDEQYIAVPTASFGRDEKSTALRLESEGFNLVFFGPRPIDSAKYRGFLSESDMKKVVKNANALLFLFDYEALGLNPIESLALGTPVITYMKEGPALSLKNNNFVTFVSSYDEVKKAVRSSMKVRPSTEKRIECRKSVAEFQSAKIAEIIIRRLEDKIEFSQ